MSRVGTALAQVSRSRTPCWTIDEVLGHEGANQVVAHLRCQSWYLRVLAQGEVAVGDWMTLVERPASYATFDELLAADGTPRTDPRLCAGPPTPPAWRSTSRGACTGGRRGWRPRPEAVHRRGRSTGSSAGLRRGGHRHQDPVQSQRRRRQQPDYNRMQCALRAPAERGSALLKDYRALYHGALDPNRIGAIVAVAHVIATMRLGYS